MSIPTGAILKAVASIVMPELVIAQNVFSVLFENDGSGNDDADVVSDVAEWVADIYTEIDMAMDADITPSDVKVYIYDGVDDDWDEIGSDDLVFTPAASGDMLPHGIAGLCYMRTSDADVLGLKYFAGLTEAACVDSSLVSGTLAVLLLAAGVWEAPWVGSVTGSGFIPGVWSVKNTEFVESSGVHGVKGNVAYQRRRKPGVGI